MVDFEEEELFGSPSGAEGRDIEGIATDGIAIDPGREVLVESNPGPFDLETTEGIALTLAMAD